MHAVSAVVLQRDVSLNRRVFHWFLSQDESAEKQAAYFKTNGLQLLTDTLLVSPRRSLTVNTQSDMQSVSKTRSEPDSHAPYRVFLALLDKWELGEALSRKLAVPALETIKAASTENPEEDRSLAAAVYEALEPSILWKNLYTGVEADMKEGSTKVSMTVSLADDAAFRPRSVAIDHCPTTRRRDHHSACSAYACTNTERNCKSSQASTADDQEDEKRIDAVLDSALQTAVALLGVIPDSVFTASDDEVSSKSDKAADELAYGDNVDADGAAREVRARVASGIVESVFKASQTASAAGWQPDALLHVARLNQLLIDREVPPLSKVDSKAWVDAVIGRLDKVRSFAIVEVLVDSALKASRSQLFSPPIDLSSGAVMMPVLDAVSRGMEFY